MTQKTAMSKLYSYLHFAFDIGAKQVDTYHLLRFIEQLKELEKQQIMEANTDGYEEAQRYGETSAEDYYNQKYTK